MAFYNQKSRCCCGSVDIKLGVQILAGLFIISGALSLLSLVFTSYGVVWITGTVATSAFRILPGLLVFYGVRHSRSLYLLPFTVTTALLILVLIALVALFVIGVSSSDSFVALYIDEGIYEDSSLVETLEKSGYTVKEFVSFICMFMSIACFLSIFFAVWFFTISLSAFLHLREPKCFNQFFYNSAP